MIYRALLRLYPKSIREQFAEEMLNCNRWPTLSTF